MDNKIEIFKNEQFGEVRTILEGEKVLFCAADVAKALGYTNPNKAVNDHCRANRLATDYLDKDELEQNIEFCDNLQEQKARLLSYIAVYEKKVAEYSKGIRELYMDKVKGLISESDYVEMSKDFTTERERLERVIADGEKQLAEIEEKIAAGDNRRELIEQYTNLEHLTREIVETLIDYISVGKRIPGTRNVPIEIHWNF